MSEMKQEKHASGFRLVIPFFVVLGILTVVSFIIPLRPTQSQMEKRNLAEFPEFSWEALTSGNYFDDITTWFSDTFPGREDWLTLSSNISSLHGYSEIAVAGDLPVTETIPDIPEPSDDPEPDTAVLQGEEAPEETAEATEAATEEGWGGLDAADDDAIELGDGAVIQIGDSAFNAVGFSKEYSDNYAKTLSDFADAVEAFGATVISAPAPTAVGILIESEYQEKLGCADQNATIQYMHSQMSDKVVKVDTYAALIDHNDEYVYFRTDHHWTALGAYYVYEAICETMGYEAAPLDSFEVWDQGEFEGSLYWKAPNRLKLKLDNVYAYIPQGDIETKVYNANGYGHEAELLVDMTERDLNTKYLTFLGTDYPMTEITNNSLPDGPTCILVKDSFGNCLAPFLTQNYYKVYAIDYRKYKYSTLKWLIEEQGIDDVIFSPYVIATQAADGTSMIAGRCR